MNKFITFLAAVGVFSAGQVFAQPDGWPTIPENCPGVVSIASGGVSHTVIKIDDRWFAGRRNLKYDTNDNWTFLMGNIDVGSSSAAYSAATAALSSLVFRLGPFTGPIGKWVCLYNTDANYPAIAVYPPIAMTDAGIFFNQL